MIRKFTERKRFRKNFCRVKEVATLPNLIELQRASYNGFLYSEKMDDIREDIGLREAFNDSFPIKDAAGRAQIDFCDYHFDEPKHTEDECRSRGLTFAASLKATFRLVVWCENGETAQKEISDIKEQDVYICDLPLMTRDGTFIVNGIERVIVSQMQRSPGVFFDHDSGKTHNSGKYLFAAHIVPYKGAWLDIEFDVKDLLYIRIDRKRKILATTFLMAIDSAKTEKDRAENPDREFKFSEIYGMDREEILSYFYGNYEIRHNENGMFSENFDPDRWSGVKLEKDLIDAKTGLVVLAAGEKITTRMAKKLVSDGVTEVAVSSEDLIGKYNAFDIIDPDSGIVIAEAGNELTEQLLEKIVACTPQFHLLCIDHTGIGGYIRHTLAIDKCNNREEALIELFRIMRPGEPPTLESAQEVFHNLFFNSDRYDLSAVGRVKMNARIGVDRPGNFGILAKDDILKIMKILHRLKDGNEEVDDIDNLANRRIRSVGELLENQFRLGLVRMERAVKERMGAVDISNAVPNDIINAKPVFSVIREFFGLSQLSQFMDQVNPLAEITHKRRISALGPGGLTRDRAGFDVRDVHTTHYGRICPIETPEGQNIGLINSLAIFAKIDRYGFIEAPYRRVVNGKVTDEIVYLSAMDEAKYSIAQANADLKADDTFRDEFVTCRKNGDFVNTPRDSIEYMDVSPKQILSIAAALIPFLENDDASRALMGANMQRQAVPLLRAQAPLVGTGMEAVVANDSGVAIIARNDGLVDQVDADRIVVRVIGQDSNVGVDIYNLRKFERSNQSTFLNQTPLVRKGDRVKSGDIIADGSGTDLGELALGQNVFVGFMTWRGYTFEDAIIISERIVQDDYFTSIHIEEFESMARDTKLGNEEITRDIPNISDDALRNLDEAGIVHIGAEVQAGDILVGKVTPKGESMITPEEKLLRAIFGERAADVKDSSLRVPPGVRGTVVDVKIFSRSGVEKDERSMAIEQKKIESYKNDMDAERKIIEDIYYSRLCDKLQSQKIVSSPVKCPEAKITPEYLNTLTKSQWRQIVVANEKIARDIDELHSNFDEILKKLQKNFEEKVEKLQKGDELAPGVLKVVKVYVADKRKLQPGDKLAGRHGNKGIVSKIVPVEDMPHLEDGTPIDIILNPLGVTSRMNVGQILETHLGLASKALGKKVREVIENIQSDEALMVALRAQLKDIYDSSDDRNDIDSMTDSEVAELASNVTQGIPVTTPVFDGAKEKDIVDALLKAGLDGSGQVTLYDGCSGEPFDRKITVGYIYMLKLHHMVDDKIHARSIGPYSLVTQQPLGGKAQFGGQRFGEMEVWALQAYGAAYTLQEILTVKSDDVTGRTKAYESIVKGDENIVPGIPESFNVLMKELRGLGLNFEFQQDIASGNDSSDLYTSV
ncbi:MAG: DNA-directed RNA polymerase subunit beta [Holosporaceae bacterium]|jgi:DNA-directed RNA polymerase subunit beta|nr:DNA-directed RNA polymerase subunit beta [Holosporaceae bacterium]